MVAEAYKKKVVHVRYDTTFKSFADNIKSSYDCLVIANWYSDGQHYAAVFLPDTTERLAFMLKYGGNIIEKEFR